ncbi:MAG TPA: TolC family protein [Thermoanaerobaculaceae bacterium]|nr:TolC family protein [Thermoanaerobaculaceae bacterium]
MTMPSRSSIPGTLRASRLGAASAFAIAAGALALGRSLAAETVRLTADAAAARVVEVSSAAAAALERTNAAHASVASADASAGPQLLASAALARRSSVPAFVLPFTAPGQPPLVLVPDITTTYAAGLRLQQPLYTGGAIGAQRGAARADLRGADAGRAQTTADLRLAAQTSYWQAVRTAASVDVARAQEERAQRLLADTQALLDAGMAVDADVLAARERVASARVGTITAEANAADAHDQLRSLLHLPPDAVVELADTLAGRLPAPPAAVGELVRRALDGRPEVGAAGAAIAGLAERADLAGAPARPSVAAVAAWDYDRPNARYFPQLDQFKQSWSVGVFGSWTLYDGGKAGADAAAARAQAAAAAHDRDELQRRITVEVQTDARRLSAAIATVEAADAARAAAVERESAARDRHAAGLAAMAEILDAEAQLAAAEQQQVDTRAAAWLAAATLDRAVGR